MNIQKIIKVYFIFVMVVVSMAALSYNDTVENYIASVFHFSNTAAKSGLSAALPAKEIQSDKSHRVFVSHNENPDLINFTIINDPEKSFAIPGSQKVKIMDFVFKTAQKEMILEDLNLKISGVAPENVERAMLVSGKEIIKKGKRSDEYYLFENIGYKIAGNSEGVLSLYLDLSPDLHTGQRIRMDIEEPEDILLTVGGKPYSINQYYPIDGKYLSIARSRPWGPKWGKEDS